MIVCICHNVSDRTIRKSIRNGACCMRDLRDELNVTTQCGKCACTVRDILREETVSAPSLPLGLMPQAG